MQAFLRFHGATREVTGSMHLVEANGHTIALDCGLFQGRRAEANLKNRIFPCEPRKIDAVVLSHAHIDHCGKLPRLVKEGYEGPIYATPATCDLARILLADSAHIQEEDAIYWNKKRVRRGDAPIEPLYSAADADQTMPLFQPRRLGDVFEVVPGVRACFYEAGHMLGSAGVRLEIDGGNGKPTRVTYTGDLGRTGMELLHDPAPLPECDYLICESTYGARVTSNAADMPQEFAETVNKTIDRGGKLIIPAFAVGRTQVIVYAFHVLLLQDKIRRHIPLIVDSPLALHATEVFRRHPEIYDRETQAIQHIMGDVFSCAKCEYIENVEQSKALHGRNGPMIIVSASGMCEVGRILHHLKNNIENPQNTVLIVGFQAAHTLGRRLVERQKQVKIFGEVYQVKAKIKVLTGFSAHANANELMAQTRHLAPIAKQVFLVHGESEQAEAFAARMRAEGFKDVVIPESGQAFRIH